MTSRHKDLPDTEAGEVVDRAKRSLQFFTDWIDQRVEPIARAAYPLELAAWRKELAHIRDLLEQSGRLRIALIGTTGAGKSTFLNAVLGQEVLPVGVMQPCTAFVTAVSHSTEPGYRVTVQFCTRQEWQRDLEALVLALRPGETEDEGEGRNEGKRLVEAARKRIQAVYDVRAESAAELSKLTETSVAPDVEKVFAAGSVDVRAFSDAKDMQSYLRKLIRGESHLWPLVKQVGVSGPYDCLAGGLELVDLPGLNDPNEARVEVTREFLRTSPFVWVVFSMVRGLTEDIQRILGEERLLRTLVLSGTYGALSLVGTKADDIDANIADQLGLPEDCTQSELVGAYREQTVDEARRQLEQMVRDLASKDEGGDTLERMVEIARRVRVHTTSASGYNKLKGIGRLRKDYGLNEDAETGIPDVHSHLLEIGRGAGLLFNAHAAIKRVDQLRDEVAFFFRAKAQTPSAAVEEARARFQRERDDFCASVRNTQQVANDQLKIYRERFLEKMSPLLAASVHGVRRVTEGWRGIHWATLRATVQRNGAYKSPTTGRSYDLNEDLAEPLLGQLPLSWEEYFTDDLERVTTEFVVKLTESGKSFCGRVRLIVDLLFKRQDKSVESQLAWFQDKVALLAQTSRNEVLATVRERRMELAATMPLVARARMQSSYDASKGESGSGMKLRILQNIEAAALSSAQPIYSTIQSDLLEGLTDLDSIIVGMLRTLTQAAEDQSRIVAHNASVDADEASFDPVVAELLASMPRRTEIGRADA